LAAEPTGGVSSGYLTDFLAIRGTGGHPQARATLGKRDIEIRGGIINKKFAGDGQIFELLFGAPAYSMRERIS
jgi:hypothetical protein